MSLSLRNVSLWVDGQPHIHDTSLDLADNGFNVLLGTTLAGKTTLMQLMAGLLKPGTGEVWFRGKDVTHLPVQKRNVAMVYQQFINYPNMSVYDNIASPLKVAGLRRAQIEERVEPVAELLRLTPFLKRRPSELSGGQQQRCAMARALVKDADLVLFDEPLANLDYKLREELRDELPRLFADRDCTVVYATTEPTEALLLGGMTATLHEGRVTQFGPAASVYSHPDDLTTAQVYSEPPMNIIAVTKRGNTLVAEEGVQFSATENIARLADGKYQLGIRAHHVSPLKAKNASAFVPGVVLVTELSGSESTIHFQFNSHAWVSQANGIHPLDVGELTEFSLDLSRALMFDADGSLVLA
ncbi:MAG: ABC transporter ATP-binding protein [Burkholderiaceae bacterium]